MAEDKWSKLYQQVAAEAWREMNQKYQEFRTEEPDGDVDCETYLYVFANGSWTIDHAQYIPTTNGCIAAVPLAQYNGPAELAEDIEANEDWNAIEDAESEED